MGYTEEEFIQKIAPLVQKNAPKYNILVCSPIIAQAFIESRYGNSGLAQYHNYFGLKVSKSWKGKSVTMKTKEEYVKGVLTPIYADFRVYDSMDHGVIGYFDFTNTARYQNLKGITDPQNYCETIKADGYATSSTYVKTLMDTIRTYTLTKYDPANKDLEVLKPIVTTGVSSVLDPRVVAGIALAEVGYLEKASGDLSYLYDASMNAGDKNYTKYGYEMHQIYPQTMDYPAAWCDCFSDWCFMKAYGVTNAKVLLGGNFDDYTVNSAQLYKNQGSYIKRGEGRPQIGDQIFFRNSVRICHTGIVVNVDDNNVYTVEGNTSSEEGVVANGGCVRQKSYSLTYSAIDGYGRPKYSTTINIPSSVSSSPSKVVKWVGVVNTHALNVRRGAGTSFANLVSYPKIYKDTKVNVCDTVKDSSGNAWYYISINGDKGLKYGFVSAKYITKEVSSSSVADKRDTSLSGTYVVVTGVLNMRKGPNSTFDVVTKLPKGSRVQCYGYYSESNGTKWLYVTNNSYTGFCSSVYLEKA